MNPDKAIRRPYLGLEAVSFFSTLHDDLSGRRCGRIAGCHAFHLPQGLRARLFAGIVQEFQPVVLPPLRCAAGQFASLEVANLRLNPDRARDLGAPSPR